MAQPPPKTIVIIGGSLTGLFTGLILSRLGNSVTILERTPTSSFRDQGAGMSISPCIPPLFHAMKDLGTSGSPIIDIFKLYDRTGIPYYDDACVGFRILNQKGGVKQNIKLPDPLVVGTTSWELLYNVLRANFDGGYEGGFVKGVEKKEGDGKTRYLSGVKFTGVEELRSDLVRVEYENPNGEKEYLDANFLIGADGPSSAVRKSMEPESGRTYACYVAWRGNVKEDLLSKETLDALGENVGFHYYKGGHMLTYRIAGHDGTMKPGERNANIVWYHNVPSTSLSRILTDTSGRTHNYSLGINKIRPSIITEQREIAANTLTSPLNEIFQKIEQPFIQAITENLAEKAVFMNGKVIFITVKTERGRI